LFAQFTHISRIMKPVLSLLLLLCATWTSNAQSYTLKGAVTDTLNANRLQMASVTLLRASDSILQTFTRTDASGNFTLTVPAKDKYLLMVSFPSFADYVDVITLKDDKTVDLGVIPMVSKSHLLSEFVLKQQLGAIKIKGDTTEYMADSFAVRENATVEELLKKLPGLQVNKNGEVVAQGETVKKILVDGEEFFTDDPAVVTKSLQAKAVEKVQVYDKKSDQAEFTGIDDGVREKTINLQLKEDRKKGYFGKLNLGGGTDGYFENQGMINAFKGKRKLSAFGIMANTGKVGLGWQDRDKFGSGNNNEMTEDGFSFRTMDQDDEDYSSWSGTYNGQGLPKVWTGGAHYSNKWFEDKLHLSGNYRYAKQIFETVGNTLTQYNLTGLQYYTDEQKTSFTNGERHRGDGLFEWKMDSTSTLKLTANAGYSNTITDTRSATSTIDTAGNTLNRNVRDTRTDASAKSANASLSYKKKFAKKGRTLSLTIDESFKETTSDVIFNSYTEAVGMPIDTLDFNQAKDNNSRRLELKGKASYTEPLSKVAFLELNYGLTVNNSFSQRLTYNKSATGETYTDLDSAYSSDYDFDVLTNTGGGALRFVFKKYNFSFGGSVSNTVFKQHDNLRDTNFNRNFNNFFPRASFSWRPGQQTSLTINYSGATSQPTIDQIQPIRQNTDPLNIVIGNPDLRQQFEHNINIMYHNYKVMTSVYRYAGGNFSIVQDDISRSESINEARFRTYQYVNVDGNFNGNLWGGIGKDFKKLGFRGGLNIGAGIARNNTFVNGVKNISDNNTLTLGVDLNKEKEKKYEIAYNPSVTFNSNTSSINGTTTNYWTTIQQVEGSIQLPHKFEVGMLINWNIRQRVAEFDRNNDVFTWNAYVSRKFLKADQLELRASAFDILNQNKGFSRFGYGNTVTEQNYNTIRRYGLLSLIWNFTKSPVAAQPNDEVMKIKL
jgi:hypothetical protein